MKHDCIIEKRKDEFANQEQYLIRCRCHVEHYIVWRPTDPPYVCPKEPGMRAN